MTAERKVKIKNEYLRLIIDLGCDYDGFNDVTNLKGVIDDIVTYAKWALNEDDKKIIYYTSDDGSVALNILQEVIENGDEND